MKAVAVVEVMEGERNPSSFVVDLDSLPPGDSYRQAIEAALADGDKMAETTGEFEADVVTTFPVEIVGLVTIYKP